MANTKIREQLIEFRQQMKEEVERINDISSKQKNNYPLQCSLIIIEQQILHLQRLVEILLLDDDETPLQSHKTNQP